MKRKNIIYLLILFIIGIITIRGCYYLNERYNTTHGVWGVNWDFNVPKPSKYIVKLENIDGFPAEGASYYICEYNDEIFNNVKALSFWNEFSESKANDLIELISKFKENAVFSDKVNTFSKYPLPNLVKGKISYYIRKRDDGSYFISLMNIKEKQLYIMEWVQ